MLDIYFSRIEKGIAPDIYPDERKNEIADCKNKSVAAQKIAVWELLKKSLELSLNADMSGLRFSKNEYGKWSAEGVNFSLSHTKHIACVALSSSSVGVDMEEKEDFYKRTSSRFDGLKLKIATKKERGEEIDMDRLLSLWTKKESLYKLGGAGAFVPKEIEAEAAFCRDLKLFNIECRVAYSGDCAQEVRFFEYKSNAPQRL